ncbi:MAG: PBSX family phage terminase large subunit [Oscillospiraceae bacterium]|nr:PBSX family phage terminase large subunit [Oscillospiraceae bacterium]
MQYKEFGEKQLYTLTWWSDAAMHDYDAIICDGSIRAGKTMTMAVSFILWAFTAFDKQVFAICGKTIESVRRNIVTHLPQWLDGIVRIQERRSENLLIISFAGKTNRFYLFGGKDEGSAALIQGMTLAGVMFDEVALMPRSFVEQALARCSVEGSKFWFNCNPDSPEHWFYKEWIQKHKEKNALYLHFTMKDNNSLSEKVKKRYENMYSGVFYDRFIRGLWVVAEGLVYPRFSKADNVTEDIPESGTYYISIDYGTLNPFSAGLWCVSDGKAVRIKEYYHSGRDTKRQLTDEEYHAALEKLIQYTDSEGILQEYEIDRVVIDPSAASFIACMRRHGKFRVKHAVNTVIDGIRNVTSMLNSQRLFIHSSCKDSIKEFGLYSWDDKAQEDKVIKENDHAMDDIRYFVNTILVKEFKWLDWR